MSLFCAGHLVEELVGSAGWAAGDLAAALTQAYFRLDVMLDSPEGRAELRRMIEASKLRAAK